MRLLSVDAFHHGPALRQLTAEFRLTAVPCHHKQARLVRVL